MARAPASQISKVNPITSFAVGTSAPAQPRTSCFRLIDPEALSLTLEPEEIWRAWNSAFHRGDVALSTHPALPGQNPRFTEITRRLEMSIVIAPTREGRLRAEFHTLPNQDHLPPGPMRELEVEWAAAS